MTEEEAEVLAAARTLIAARKKVLAWMSDEGMAGRLRQNSDSPHWPEYEHAQKRWGAALDALAALDAKSS